MASTRKSRILSLWIVLGLSAPHVGCSSMPDEMDREPAPDVAEALSTINTVAAEYHLTGQLDIAGPIEAPVASLDPWLVCLRSPSETRFIVAIAYQGNTYVSAREATIADQCEKQAYHPLVK
jgi:hypothetical protein